MLLKIYGCDFTQGGSLLGKFYMHQENNAPFMIKNVNFTFFHGHFWDTLKNTLTELLTALQHIF